MTAVVPNMTFVGLSSGTSATAATAVNSLARFPLLKALWLTM